MDYIELKKLGLPSYPSFDDIVTALRNASDHYYNSGNNILTDEQYDLLKEHVESVDPTHDILKEIGAPTKKKISLPYEMWSMNKVKPDTKEITSWINKYNTPADYVISAKLDGVSGLIQKVGSGLYKMYTRGDGKQGQDISHLLSYLKFNSLYENMTYKGENMTIRGEFIINKCIFDKQFTSRVNSNPRSVVSGLMNTSIPSDDLKYVEFIPYEIIYPIMIPQEQLEYFDIHSDISIRHCNINGDGLEDNLKKIYGEWRDEYQYQIDGIICTHNKIYPREQGGNPLHAIAFKMALSEQMKQSKVVDVIWTPSKDGLLKPRIRIEKLTYKGFHIEYVTGFNAAYIEKNNINIGTVVEVYRSGDVIPQIHRIISSSKTPKMPEEEYHWNDSRVDVVITDVSTNSIVKIKNIAHFFKELGVVGLSVGTITKLYNANYDSVKAILAMTISDYLKVDGFKETLSTKICVNIAEAIKSVTLITLMKASNMLGRGIGNSKLQLILDSYPDIVTSKESIDDKYIKVQGLTGMADISSKLFIDNIDKFIAYIHDIGLEHKLTPTTKPVVTTTNAVHKLYKKKIVLTGKRNKEIDSYLKEVGADISSSVTSSTYKLIMFDVSEESSKSKKAKQMEQTHNKVIIISHEEFISKYMS
jgi:NAD-dependent DNA ligase